MRRSWSNKIYIQAFFLTLKLKARFAKCCMWSVILFETDLDAQEEIRKVLGKFSALALDQRINSRREDILGKIRKRKASWLGDILREDCLEWRIMERTFYIFYTFIEYFRMHMFSSIICVYFGSFPYISTLIHRKSLLNTTYD